MRKSLNSGTKSRSRIAAASRPTTEAVGGIFQADDSTTVSVVKAKTNPYDGVIKVLFWLSNSYLDVRIRGKDAKNQRLY